MNNGCFDLILVYLCANTKPNYLCANTLSPLFWLHIEILHEYALALPGGVGEAVQSESHQLVLLIFQC